MSIDIRIGHGFGIDEPDRSGVRMPSATATT